MHRASPQFDYVSPRIHPAWLFSFVFHLSAIILLGLTIHATPRGANDFASLSSGIVLNANSAPGDLYEGEEEGTSFNTSASSSAAAEPADILALLPNEPAPREPVRTASLVLTPVPPLNASTTAGNGNSAAGQPDAGQFTQGGGRRGAPGGRGYAKVSVFGVQGEGNKFVYLFDRSSSMEGAPLATAKRQLLESLTSLGPVHQFHIIFFNTKPQSFDITGGSRRIAFATDRNKQLAANFVGGVTADGGTDRLTALKTAISFAPDVIFFLTDADDPMSPAELREIAEDNSRAAAAICVIEFGRRQSPSPNNFLAELARTSGGSYGYVNTATFTAQRR